MMDFPTTDAAPYSAQIWAEPYPLPHDNLSERPSTSMARLSPPRQTAHNHYNDGPFTSKYTRTQAGSSYISIPPSFSSSPIVANASSSDRDEETEYVPPSPVNVAADECLLKSRSAVDGTCKLSISDIVNHSPKSSRSLKRRADEMSQDDEEPYEPKPISDDIVLPDAQDRSQPLGSELLNSQEARRTCNSSQISSTPAVVRSEQPARKKMRTSGSPSGVGKFVSGVCVGVAGVFAAFLATIPLSVREEALHEFHNGY